MKLLRSLFSKYPVLAAGMAFFAAGCSSDLDPNADYKETMVIYSVLNPTETVHYAKVNKAYLNTNSNAFDIAANSPDSTNYKAEDLTVKLQKLMVKGSDTTITGSYDMIRIDTTGKEPGTFFSGKQIIYRTVSGKPGKLDDQAVYRVVATNIKSQVTASGATGIIQQGPTNNANSFCVFNISNANPETPIICFTETSPSQYFPHIKNNAVVFRAPKNASIFTVKSEFHYTDSINGVVTDRIAEWYDANNFIFESTNNETKRLELPDFTFYNNVQRLVPPAPAGTVRKTKFILFKITAGSESLKKNFQANNTYSVFSQTRPQYDNIQNGAGLVGSRITRTVRGNFHPDARLKLINEYPALNFKK